MSTFSEFTLSPVLKGNLAANGYVRPTPVQSEAIPAALSGRDVVATAQTGTGKTLAFVLPILESLLKQPRGAGVRALVLSPTRELALQIHEVFALLAPGTEVRAAVAVGGLAESTQLHALRSGAQVLIATPGRLCDFLKRRLIRLDVRTLVLDEADRMLDMGFLPSIRAILDCLPRKRQTMFFSATIESSVAHLVDEYLDNPLRVAIGPSTRPAERVELRLYEVDSSRKLTLLHRMLEREQGSFLVFSRTKHGADRLAKRLATGGVKTACIHGNRSQSQRNHALRGFQEGRFRVLVATDVAARGIHVDGVAHVVNYDLPQAPEDFIHRVGRTGRAGASGTASTFGTPAERADIRRIERALNIQLKRQEAPLGEPVPSEIPRVPLTALNWRQGISVAPLARRRPAPR